MEREKKEPPKNRLITMTESDLQLEGGTSESEAMTIGVILASLYAVVALIPLNTLIGMGSILNLAICIAPIFGVILGGARGFVYGLIAGFLALTLTLGVIGNSIYLAAPPTILGPALAGLLVGFAARPRSISGKRVLGPALAAIYLTIVIIVFMTYCATGWPFIIPYVFAALTALALQFMHIEFKAERQGVWRYLQFIPFTLIGAFADLSMLTLSAIFLFGFTGEVFLPIVPVMIVERTFSIVLSSIILYALLLAFGERIFS